MPTSPPTSPTTSRDGMQPAAVLWDFDGTLVDTEPIWMRAEYALVAELGGEWNDEHAHQLVGNALIDTGRYIAQVVGRPDLDPAWVVDQLIGRVLEVVRTTPIPWRPGARELLESLHQQGITCALVSASYRSLLDAVVERIPDGTFRCIIAGDAVTHGKPHPEPYLKACAELGVEPADCVVLEDSIPGAASGNAAGCVVVAVKSYVDLPEAERRVLIPTLEGLDPDGLAQLARGARPEQHARGARS